MIVQRIKKNPFLFCAAKCFRYRKDRAVLEQMIAVTSDPSLAELEHRGPLPIQLCRIELGSGKEGFFAAMRWMLNGLYYAEHYGLTPHLKFTENCMYYDREYGGDRDPFEYYFEPANRFSDEEADRAACVVRYTSRNRLLAEGMNEPDWYCTSEAYIRAMAGIAGRYCRFNGKTEAYIRSSMDRLPGGGKTLGVHIRGTDFKGGYRYHPRFVTVEQYMEAVDEALAAVPFDRIFLATDDLEILEAMKARYGERLVWYPDVFRSRGTAGAHTVGSGGRRYHRYLLGLEVLRDMATLSRCDGLIAGLSQVSTYTRIQKLADGGEFEYRKILSNGIHHKGKLFWA